MLVVVVVFYFSSSSVLTTTVLQDTAAIPRAIVERCNFCPRNSFSSRKDQMSSLTKGNTASSGIYGGSVGGFKPFALERYFAIYGEVRNYYVARTASPTASLKFLLWRMMRPPPCGATYPSVILRVQVCPL